MGAGDGLSAGTGKDADGPPPSVNEWGKVGEGVVVVVVVVYVVACLSCCCLSLLCFA